MFTEDTAHRLSDANLADQLRLLHAEESTRNDTRLWAAVHTVLSGLYRPHRVVTDPLPVAVTFAAESFENGSFLTTDGTVYFADGTDTGGEPDEFGDLVETLLTNEYGTVGPDSLLAVNVLTGAILFDTYPAVVRDTVTGWVSAANTPTPAPAST